MRPIRQISDRTLMLLEYNIDTDQIIPARFLRKPRSSGYHNYLFYDARYDSQGKPYPDSPILDGAAPRSILLAGRNFGCGSSREGAVYALVDYGIRVVIAPKIADIFRNNAVRNGLLPVVLEEPQFDRLVAALKAAPNARLTVDLETQTLQLDSLLQYSFEIDEGSRQRLLSGTEDITETMSRQKEIDAFAERYRRQFPWAKP